MTAVLVAIGVFLRKALLWIGVSIVGKGLVWVLRFIPVVFAKLWISLKGWVLLKGAGALVMIGVTIFFTRMAILIATKMMAEFGELAEQAGTLPTDLPPWAVFMSFVEFVNAFVPLTESLAYGFVLIGVSIYVGHWQFFRRIFMTALSRG